MPTAPRIQPTVGDIVHYYNPCDKPGLVPLAAIVIAVRQSYVNLFVISEDGMRAGPVLGVSYANGPHAVSGQNFWCWGDPARQGTA